MRECRKVPAQRIIGRLRLDQYDQPVYDRGATLMPRRVELPLRQHIGAPAVPVVSPGAEVKRGDLIGEIPEGSLGARVHASVAGTVTLVEESRILITASGA